MFAPQGWLWAAVVYGIMVSACSSQGAPINIKSFGAIANDGLDDSAALQLACAQAFATGQQIFLPSGTYEIDRNTTITCTRDLYVFGEAGVTINLDGLLTFRADIADDSVVLRASAKRKSRSITVDDTSRCSPGDLLYINTSVVAESTWGTPKREVHRIKSIPNRTTLTFEEPSLFSYQTTDAGLKIEAYHGRQITIDNIAFEVNDRQLATQYFAGGTTVRNCRWSERDVGDGDGYHYSPGASIDVLITNAVFRGGFYGCIPACSRNVVFEQIEGYNCEGDVIAPNNWCYGVYVNGISGSDCGSLVDSHPSFEVHYSGVSGTITGLPNLRSLGGSIQDYFVESSCSDPGKLYFQNITLQVDRDIYDETLFTLNNVVFETPNLDPGDSLNYMHVQYGYQAVLKDVDWWLLGFYPGPTLRNLPYGFHKITLSGSTLTRLAFWPDQQVTISDCRLISPTARGDPQNIAISTIGNAYCWTTNTSFQGYSHVIRVTAAQNVGFTNCRFIDCDDIFAAVSSAPRVTFDGCVFQNVLDWGNVDTTNFVVRNCTFTGTVMRAPVPSP